jgi:hypothetical protein
MILGCEDLADSRARQNWISDDPARLSSKRRAAHARTSIRETLALAGNDDDDDDDDARTVLDFGRRRRRVKDYHHDVNHDAHFGGDYHDFWRDATTGETRADDDASLRGWRAEICDGGQVQGERQAGE